MARYLSNFSLQARGLCCVASKTVCRTSTSVAASQLKESEQPQSEMKVKPLASIPGPKPLPIVGNLFELSRNITGLQKYYGECFKKYGDIFKFRAFGNTTVVFKDPDSLEMVLRAEGKNPQREKLAAPKLKWIIEDMKVPCPIAFEEGSDWRRKRTAIGKQTLPKIVHSYIPGLNDVLCRFTDYLRASRDEEGKIVDFAQPTKMLLVEMSGKFVYGADIRAVGHPSEDGLKLVKSVTGLVNCIAKIIVEPPLFKLFPTKIYREVVDAYKGFLEVGTKYAHEVIKRVEAGEESEVQGLLEQWLRDGKLTKEEYISQSSDMFGAGVDTTANQGVFLIFEVAKRPEVQEKLYAEIKSVLGDSLRHPTAEDLAAMPYLKGCVMESFRVRPTIHTSNGRVLKEDAIILGYHIPAKTQILYSNYEAGKDETLFPNPDKFDPERWTRDQDERSAFASLPFGFGPRSCYGKRFAELELKLILLQMVRSFKMKTYADDMPMAEGSFMRPAGNVPLNLINRSM